MREKIIHTPRWLISGAKDQRQDRETGRQAEERADPKTSEKRATKAAPLEHMSLAAQILTRVWLTPHPYVTFQIGPVDGVVFALDPESDTLQIGFSKRRYLELFTEGHHFLEERNWSADVALMGDVELWRFFLATAALLATTNDHLTAWRLHERAETKRMKVKEKENVKLKVKVKMKMKMKEKKGSHGRARMAKKGLSQISWKRARPRHSGQRACLFCPTSRRFPRPRSSALFPSALFPRLVFRSPQRCRSASAPR